MVSRAILWTLALATCWANQSIAAPAKPKSGGGFAAGQVKSYKQGRYKVKTTLMRQMSPHESGWRWSPDYSRYFILRGKDDKKQAIIDGKAGALYDFLGVDTNPYSVKPPEEGDDPFERAAERASLPFSPNSKHVAYGATRGRMEVVVTNGQEGKEYDDVVLGSLSFSRNSRHLIYIAKGSGGVRVVADGKEFPASPAILEQSLQFSRDGEHLAYIARMPESTWVVIDGKPGPKYNMLYALQLTANASHHAYIAQDGATPTKPPGAARVVVDGKAGQDYKDIDARSLSMSPDGLHYGYSASTKNGYAMVVDGVELPNVRLVGKLIFSPNEKHWAYVASARGSEVVMLDGRELGSYYGVDPGSLVFSPDGARLVYLATDKQRKNVVVVNGSPVSRDR